MAPKLVAIALSCLAGNASAADDPLGFYFRIEGSLGFDFTSPIGENYLAGKPVTHPWGDAISGVTGSSTWRSELGYEFLGANGALFRTAMVTTGWSASSNSGTGYGFVGGEWDPVSGLPVFEIQINDPEIPTQLMVNSLTRQYWEIIPELLVGTHRSDDSVRWLGIKPFFGEFSQNSSVVNNLTLVRSGVETNIDAETYGALLTLQKEKWLKDDLKCYVSLGLGPYGLQAESQSRGLTLGGEIDDTRTIFGVRGQLAAGADWTINPKLSLGLVGRADLWSGSPTVTGPGAYGLDAFRRPDGVLVVSPPRIAGDWNINADVRVDLFAGIRMTYLLSSKKE